jgi:predicted nuclease of predicted toxin-antitoxin system
MTDTEIWDYALKNGLVIFTKDADFYDRIMTNTITPKIIFLQIGNCTLRELHRILSESWNSIINKLSSSSMVILRKDQIITIE